MNCETQHCKACDVWFRNMKDRQLHLQSLKHQRNVGLLPQKPLCSVCNIRVSNLTKHQYTAHHKYQIRKCQGIRIETIAKVPLAETTFTLSG